MGALTHSTAGMPGDSGMRQVDAHDVAEYVRCHGWQHGTGADVRVRGKEAEQRGVSQLEDYSSALSRYNS